MAIEPDTKDWTWVLERECPECGTTASALDFREIPALIREDARAWGPVLERADVRLRPDESTWSPLEYAAHVRDVLLIFADRFQLMLAEDAPAFANWDQDAAAVESDYAALVPETVVAEVVDAGDALAALLENVPDAALHRTAGRSDGPQFTVITLAQYLAHDLEHHLWDVR